MPITDALQPGKVTVEKKEILYEFKKFVVLKWPN